MPKDANRKEWYKEWCKEKGNALSRADPNFKNIEGEISIWDNSKTKEHEKQVFASAAKAEKYKEVSASKPDSPPVDIEMVSPAIMNAFNGSPPPKQQI